MSRDPSRDQRVLATVDAIPAGRVATYGQVATEAGLPGRARLVGRLLRELPAGSALPWHRVLRADGRISPRSGAAEQRRRLRAEGVKVDAVGRVHLASFGWDPAG
jgi:methylated-DNA-protein-cysteine methyltransferase-like protein